MIQIFVKEGQTLIAVGKVEDWGKRLEIQLYAGIE